MSKIYLVKKIDELDNLECETFGENKEEAEKYLNEVKQTFSDWQTVKTKDGYEFRKDNKFVEISILEYEEEEEKIEDVEDLENELCEQADKIAILEYAEEMNKKAEGNCLIGNYHELKRVLELNGVWNEKLEEVMDSIVKFNNIIE